MKKFGLWIGLLLFCCTSLLKGQSKNGEVIYVQTDYWQKIVLELPYLSQEEKDRAALTWRKSSWDTERMKLSFDDSLYYYTYVLNDKSEESNWSYKKSEYQIYRNYVEHTTFDRLGILGKNYIIKGEIPKWKWKILGEIKEVAGYVCMKAETRDSIRNQKITAWFTDKILIPAGPGMYGGLPGLILEININDGASIIEAETITLGIPQHIVKPKAKGKVIDFEMYSSLISNYIKDCIERRRNPYWELNYGL
jgi:GLPGLI family protein